MRQPWSKMNMDGATFRSSDGELDRMYDEMPSLPEPPAQAEGSDSDGPARPPSAPIRLAQVPSRVPPNRGHRW